MATTIIAYSYIRFSSQEQAKGDSLRRQIAERDAWLRRHPNVRLDRHARYTDEGKSGRGEHLHGALGVFIAKVKSGQIPPGCILIVENLDRLGRLPVSKQLELFLELIHAAVTIVCTMDSQEYSESSLNGPYGMGQLIGSIAIMKRAFDESDTKSRRSGSNWKQKRLSRGVGTKRVPGWIRVEGDRFVLIEDRVLTLRRIFRLTAEGMGKDRIAKILNEEKVEPWGVGKQKGRAWHDTYISKLLTNPAVLGRFQWHTGIFDPKTGRKVRTPEGEPIEKHFPQAVSQRLFDMAAKVRSARVHRPGPIGDKVRNLFTGLAFCSLTRFPIVFSNKNPRFYLKSSSPSKPKNAKLTPWPYEQFEKILFDFIGELNIDSLVNTQHTPELEAVEDQVAELQAKSKKLREGIDRVLVLLSQGEDSSPSQVLTFIEGKEKEAKSVEEQISNLKTHHRKAKEGTENIEKALKGINLIRAKRHDPGFRLKLRDELPNLIEALFIDLDAPEKFRVEVQDWSLAQLTKVTTDELSKVFRREQKDFQRRGGKVRAIHVLFRTGVVRDITVQTIGDQTMISAREGSDRRGQLMRDGSLGELRMLNEGAAYTTHDVDSLNGRRQAKVSLTIPLGWQSKLGPQTNVFGSPVKKTSTVD